MSSTSPLMPSITVKSGAIRSAGPTSSTRAVSADVAIFREARRQPGAGRLRGGARRLERGARGKAPEHGQPPHATLVEQMGTSADLRLHRHRNPEIHREVGDGAVEVGRRDAHDRHGVVVDPDRTADDAGVAREAPLPERVADHDDRGAALDGILAGEEAAADHRLHAEHVEVVRARQDAPYRFGDARLRHGARAQVEAADAERGEARRTSSRPRGLRRRACPCSPDTRGRPRHAPWSFSATRAGRNPSRRSAAGGSWSPSRRRPCRSRRC